MRALEIPATPSSPGADFNYEKGEFHIYGRSLNNNVDFFFKPIVKWVDEYIKQPRSHTAIYLNMEYINTSSANYIFGILKKLKGITDNRHNSLTITWRYEAADDDMLKSGKIYSEMLKMPFVFEEQ